MTSEFRIPAPLQNTIENLSYLANTQPGDKLFFHEKCHTRSTNWIQRIKRLIFNESLDNQQKIIKEIIDLGLDSLKMYSTNVHYHRLIREFFRAKDGLTNLRNTYLKEGRDTGNLDNLIYIMDTQLNAISREDKQKANIIPPKYDNTSGSSEEDDDQFIQ
jgi:hypothetical protein